MTSTTPRARARHRTDLLSLFSGVLFLAAALLWAGSHYLNWEIDWEWNLPKLGWFVAGGLILLGLLGILASLRRDRTQIPAAAGPPSAPQAVRPDPDVRPDPSIRPEPDVRPDPDPRPEPPAAAQPSTPPRPDGDPTE